jgi:hypothetical protein
MTLLGERGRQMTWGVTFSSYMFGCIIGGLAVGGLVGGVGQLSGVGEAVSEHGRLAAFAMASVGAAAVEARAIRGRRVPALRRQVNELWLSQYRGWVYGLGFGLQLGFALTTVVTSMTTYATLIAALLSGSVVWGALIGGVFGLARGLSLWPAGRVHSLEKLASLNLWLDRWSERPDTSP